MTHALNKLLTGNKQKELAPEKPKVPKSDFMKSMGRFWKDQVNYQNNKKTKNEGKFKNFRISQVGFEPRLIYLSALNYITFSTDVPTFRKMANGDYVHERWGKWVESAGILVKAEGNVSGENPPIRGRYDFLVNVDGTYWVIELKSIHTDGYSAKEPKWEHVCQHAMYMWLEKIPLGGILYEDKNTNTSKLYEVHMDLDTGDVKILCPGRGEVDYGNVIERIYKNLNYVYDCIEGGTIPERCGICTPKCYHYKRCQEVCEGREVRLQENSNESSV